MDHWFTIDIGLSCGSLNQCQCLSVHLIKPRFNPRLRALWVCHIAIGSKPGPCLYRCQAGRPRRGHLAWDFAQFCPILVHLFLKSKIIQNSWNSLEINKIWMEHSVKLILFPRSWRLECEFMAVNSANNIVHSITLAILSSYLHHKLEAYTYIVG